MSLEPHQIENLRNLTGLHKSGELGNEDFNSQVMEFLIESGEQVFSDRIKDLPYIVKFNLTNITDAEMLQFIEAREHWLVENATGEYVSFSNDAIGRYKECWQYVYFKNKHDALIFRLTW